MILLPTSRTVPYFVRKDTKVALDQFTLTQKMRWYTGTGRNGASEVKWVPDASDLAARRCRSMPYYYFHVYDAGRKITDLEGSLCEDVASARIEAIETARELAHQAIDNGVPSSSICVEITGEDGGFVSALQVLEVVENPRAPLFKDACK